MARLARKTEYLSQRTYTSLVASDAALRKFKLPKEIPNGSLDLLKVHAGEYLFSGDRSNKIGKVLIWFLPVTLLGNWAAFAKSY